MFIWDGKDRWMNTWEQDLVLGDAFKFSCVPCYQEVARDIGVTTMKAFTEKLEFGDLKIDSTNIDKFWLMGDSRISQMEQINFLTRLYNRELDIAERTENILRDIMLEEENDQYKLSGKSGLSNDNGHYNGWYVGYLEQDDRAFFFATNIEPREGFEFKTFVSQRKSLTRSALKAMGLM